MENALWPLWHLVGFFFYIKVVFGCCKVSDRRRRGAFFFSKKIQERGEKMKAVVTRACFGFSLYFQSRKLVFGPPWLCIFGVFRLRVWQQGGQGMCLKVVSRYGVGVGIWGKEPKEDKGP